ncbi:coiled-coil domain-containing protein 138-like isoform X2 [Lates japonicus]|uniref:Coiled-coil domain-containing protein 138-like isoform X2 n=1 Tax=Lates japonicus TaxID=270547 RepID=A0AAD3MRC4_LATJO|nr:coiled-coil domain-containing protein 138-like isoform X2 [Lates japonicus]
MNQRFRDTESDVAHTVEKLKQKYLERRRQLLPSEDILGTRDEAPGKWPSKELKCYSKALNELFRAVANHPKQFGNDHSLHGSNEDLNGDFAAAPLQDSLVLFTETDVTLPSCLDGSPGSLETEPDRELQRAHQLPFRSSSLVEVYQEMMTVYKQLKHVALSATLRRIGEEVSKPAAQSTVLQSADPDLLKSCSETAGPIRNLPLYRSPCPHTRILSILIILRTVTQADVLAQVLDSLHTELMSEESRGLFIHYGGVCVLLTVLRASRGGLRTPIDILMQLTEQSRYLNPFLEVCSCGEFFQTVSQLLKHPRLELPSLEKLSILLQKLSSIRKNRRLFELSSLHLQIQELYHKTNHTHSFLCLNLRSILHNLK